MSTSRNTAAATDTRDDGTATTPDVLTPTITHYQKVAADFIVALDQIASLIPKLEGQHISTGSFVRSRQNIPIEFLATTIAAVEQTPELQAVRKLDVTEGRDVLQFIEAFRPVLDKVKAFENTLQFTLMSRKATLATSALQIYDIAKGIARDPNSAAVASLVANMKRDLGRRGRPKTLTAARKQAAAAALTRLQERAAA